MTVLLGLFAAMLPLVDPTRTVLGAGSAAEVLLVVLALFGCFEVLVRRSRRRLTKSHATALAFCALAAASAIWMGGREGIQAEWKDLIRPFEFMCAFFVVRTLLTTPQRTRGFVTGLWVGCGFAIVAALMHLTLGADSEPFARWGPGWQYFGTSPSDLRIYGSFGNPLNLTAYAATMLGITLNTAVTAHSRYFRASSALLATLLGIVLAATGSKIGLIAFLAATLLCWRRSTGLVVALVGVGIALSGTSGVLISRIAVMTSDADMSVSQRMLVYESTLKMIEEHPVLGVGPGGFRSVYPLFYRLSGASDDPSTYTAENFVLSTAAELGLPAAALLLGIIGMGVYYCLRSLNAARGTEWAGLTARSLGIGLICCLTIGMVQNLSSADISLFLMSLVSLSYVLHDHAQHMATTAEHSRRLARTASALNGASH